MRKEKKMIDFTIFCVGQRGLTEEEIDELYELLRQFGVYEMKVEEGEEDD